MVRTVQGEELSIVPDDWLDVHLNGSARMAIVLELDRGTTEQRDIKRKLRELLAYAHGPYQQAFGIDSITVAFATNAGAHRAERLKRWCKDILKEVQSEHQAELFLIASIPPEAPAPQRLFLSPHWQQPFSKQAVLLLEVAS